MVSEANIVAAMQDGSIQFFDRASAKILFNLPCHEFEVWNCALEGALLYSGSDDCSFKLHDVKSQTLVQANSKYHQAGVTFIKPLPGGQHFMTGSYDSQIAVWDLRK